MNIRKPIDYSVMYMKLDTVLEAGLFQLDCIARLAELSAWKY